jgi:small-conductance mechanosensitive channel
MIIVLSPPVRAQDTPDISQLAGFIRWGGVLLSVVIIVGATVVLRFVSGAASGLSARFAARRLLIQKIESFVRFGVYVGTGAICLGLSVRLDSTALTVIGGALAFAVGFAMRDLVAAFIAGITIMFDRPFQVGDRVQYGGEYGDIIEIGLRSVQMNTLDHNIVTIPNNKVLTDVTSSGNEHLVGVAVVGGDRAGRRRASSTTGNRRATQVDDLHGDRRRRLRCRCGRPCRRWRS